MIFKYRNRTIERVLDDVLHRPVAVSSLYRRSFRPPVPASRSESSAARSHRRRAQRLFHAEAHYGIGFLYWPLM
jgi:hypothetical protein